MAYIDQNVTASLLREFVNQRKLDNSISYSGGGGGEVPYIQRQEYDTSGPYDDMPSFRYSGDIDQLRKPWVNQDSFIPMLVVQCLIFIMGVVGNSLVIAALWQGRAGRCATFPCLISMAWADLLFIVICVPHAVVTAIVFYWTLSDFLCKLSGFVENLTANATVLNLILISLERYLVIAHPLSSKSLCTAKNARIALVCIWIAAIIFACPTFAIMGTDKNRFYNNVTSAIVVMCADTESDDHHRMTFAMWKVATLFIVPICVLLFCYIRVIVILWVSNRQLQTLIQPNSVNASPRSDQGIQLHPVASCVNSKPRVRLCASYRAGEDALHARRQVIKMLIVVIFIFLVCWGPKLIVHALKQLRLSFLYDHWWAYIPNMIFNILPYFQSCVNPIIYATMSKNIRNGIRQVLSSYCCWCSCCEKRLRMDSPCQELLNHTNHSNVTTPRIDNHRHYIIGTTDSATVL